MSSPAHTEKPAKMSKQQIKAKFKATLADYAAVAGKAEAALESCRQLKQGLSIDYEVLNRMHATSPNSRTEEMINSTLYFLNKAHDGLAEAENVKAEADVDYARCDRHLSELAGSE